MKLLIASDIHGSEYYTEELIKKFNEEKADKLLLLGDLLYHGPRNPLTKDYNPSKVANILNEYQNQIIAVRGNCDSEVDQMVLEYPIMSDYTQIMIDGYTLFMTHGHIYNPQNLPKLKEKVIFMFGHIHIPILKKDGSLVILNPGSISLPKENNESTYAIYENHMIQIKTLTGEIVKELSL